jgi:hypothetical protein
MTKRINIKSDNVFDYASYSNIGCIIEVVRYFLTQWPMGCHNINGMKREDEWLVITNKIVEILTFIVDRHQSNEHSWILLAKILHQRNQQNEAKKLICRYLSINPDSGLAHLTKAQIELVSDGILTSQQSLEHALSQNFEIRYHPLYCLVKGSICLGQVSKIMISKIITNM